MLMIWVLDVVRFAMLRMSPTDLRAGALVSVDVPCRSRARISDDARTLGFLRFLKCGVIRGGNTQRDMAAILVYRPDHRK